MRIVVTGGSGKIGSYVARELAAAGHEVVNFDRAPPPADRPGRWFRGDVDDFGDVLAGLSGADAVAHLAAINMPGIAPNHVVFRTNVLGTYSVHEAAAAIGIRRVVCASSSAVLGWAYREREFAPEYLPVDEDHPLEPQDAYGTAKLCEEQIGRAFASRCGMETIFLRFPGVVTPEAAKALRAEGGVRQTRFDLGAYVDVRDAASAFRCALELPGLQHAAVYVCADDSRCAEPLCNVLPRLMPEIGDMAASLTGTRSGLSNRRAKDLLEWQPRHSWRN